jgi:hypothetical protein
MIFFQIVVEVVSGTVGEGYVAIDEVHFDNIGDCETVPDFAAPGTTSVNPGTTSQQSSGGFDCDFSEGLCGWENSEESWKWSW